MLSESPASFRWRTGQAYAGKRSPELQFVLPVVVAKPVLIKADFLECFRLASNQCPAVIIGEGIRFSLRAINGAAPRQKRRHRIKRAPGDQFLRRGR